MAPATLVDARALCHSRDFQRNVGPSPTMKVGLHRLRRRAHNSALAGKDDLSMLQELGNTLRANPQPRDVGTSWSEVGLSTIGKEKLLAANFRFPLSFLPG